MAPASTNHFFRCWGRLPARSTSAGLRSGDGSTDEPAVPSSRAPWGGVEGSSCCRSVAAPLPAPPVLPLPSPPVAESRGGSRAAGGTSPGRLQPSCGAPVSLQLPVFSVKGLPSSVKDPVGVGPAAVSRRLAALQAPSWPQQLHAALHPPGAAKVGGTAGVTALHSCEHSALPLGDAAAEKGGSLAAWLKGEVAVDGCAPTERRSKVGCPTLPDARAAGGPWLPGMLAAGAGLLGLLLRLIWLAAALAAAGCARAGLRRRARRAVLPAATADTNRLAKVSM